MPALSRLIFLYGSLCERKISDGEASAPHLNGICVDQLLGCFFVLGAAYAVTDERTRLALAAMAQAKQDAATVKHLVGQESARLEAERLYLSRWKAQLLHLTEAAEEEAIKAIVDVSQRSTDLQGVSLGCSYCC